MIPKTILNNPNFGYLFSAGLLSQLGGFITDTSVALHLYRITDKNAIYLGLVRGINVFAFFLGNLIGGALGVKTSNKKILVFCEIIRIPLTISLLLFSSPAFIVLCTGLIGFFTGIFSPIKKSYSNVLVGKEEIDSAQSLNSTSMAFVHLVAPMAAALLYDHIGFDFIIGFDIVTYLLGIILLFKIIEQPNQNELSNSHKDQKSIELIKEGIKFTFNDGSIRCIFFNGVVSGLIVGFLISLLLPYLDTLYDNQESIYGILLSLFGLGGLIGGPLFLKLSKKINTGKVIVVSHLIESLLLLLWLQVENLILASFVFFIWGIMVFTRLTGQFSFVSKYRETAKHTRLFSSIEISFLLPNVLGSFLASFLVNHYSAKSLLTFMGITFIIITAIRLVMKDTKSLIEEKLI